MSKLEELRSILVDVLISDQETGGHPVVAEERRPILKEALERLVLDAEALVEHRRWLRSNDPTRRHRGLLPEGQLEAVLEGGLEVLGAGALAELSLNAAALSDLAEAVAELLPDAWMPRIEEAAADLVGRHGITIEIPGGEMIELAEEPEWMMAGALQAGGMGGRTWDFEVDAEAARWEPGMPGDLDEARAAIRVERDESDGSLTVSPEGFLRVGLAQEVEAVWRAADGTQRAADRVVDDFLPLRLRPADASPPAPGDRLEITKRHQAVGDSPGWTVRVVVAFR